jgi:hypothetical protein
MPPPGRQSARDGAAMHASSGHREAAIDAERLRIAGDKPFVFER